MRVFDAAFKLLRCIVHLLGGNAAGRRQAREEMLALIRSLLECLHVAGKKGDALARSRSGESSGSSARAVARLWSGRKRCASPSADDDDDERSAACSLLDACLATAVAHFDDLPAAQMAMLPADLVQKLLESLVAAGALDVSRLRRVGLPADVDSLVLDGPCCPETVTDRLVCELGTCPRLRVLDLSRCTLVTDAGLSGLSRSLPLRHLKLNYCVHITDASLHHISGLTALQTLELGSCEELTGAGLAALAGMAQMTRLVLSACRGLKGGLQHVAGLPQLAHLDLGWCSGLEPGELSLLSQLSQLTSLNLCSTKVSDQCLGQLSGLTRLAKLNLHRCRGVTDACAGALAEHLRGLRCLDLGQCRGFGDKGMPELAGLVRLQRLNLGGSAITNAGMPHLASLSGLTRLDLDSCDAVGDAGCLVLRHLTRLQHLDLSDTGARDATMELLGSRHAQHLRWLGLSCTGVTAYGVAQLRGLGGLVHLNIDSVALDDREVAFVSSLTGLRSLEACSIRLLAAGTTAIAQLTALTQLELSAGGIGDKECALLARLPRLVRLSLAYNRNVTDVGLRALLPCAPLLEELNLSGTGVGPGAVPVLAGLQSLHVLSLCSTRISEAAAQELRSQLPRHCLLKHSYKKDGP